MAERPAKRSRILTSAHLSDLTSPSATRVTSTNNNARYLAARNVTLRAGGNRDARRPRQQTAHSQVLTNAPEHNTSGILDQELCGMDVDSLQEDGPVANIEEQKDAAKRPVVRDLFCVHLPNIVLMRGFFKHDLVKIGYLIENNTWMNYSVTMAWAILTSL